jgi:hypothetical protein
VSGLPSGSQGILLLEEGTPDAPDLAQYILRKYLNFNA